MVGEHSEPIVRKSDLVVVILLAIRREYDLVVAIFLPAHIINLLHPSLKPLLGNGLVVGVISAIILEHVALKKRSDSGSRQSA